MCIQVQADGCSFKQGKPGLHTCVANADRERALSASHLLAARGLFTSSRAKHQSAQQISEELDQSGTRNLVLRQQILQYIPLLAHPCDDVQSITGLVFLRCQSSLQQDYNAVLNECEQRNVLQYLLAQNRVPLAAHIFL